MVRAGWSVRTTSLRIGLSFVVPLAIAAAWGYPQEGAVATGGAWAAIYARDEPYRRRLQIMVGIGLALTVVVLLGSVAAPSPVAVAVGAGLVAGIGALGCHAFDVGRPREFFLVLAFLAATQLPRATTAGALAERAALVLAGAAIVTTIAMAYAARRPRGPEERALEAFWTRVADLLQALGTPAAVEARHELLMAVEETRTMLRHSGHHGGDGDRLYAMTVSGEAVADAALGLVLRDCPTVDPGWVDAARALKASVRNPAALESLRLPRTPPGTVHGERFSWVMGRAVADADPRAQLETTLVPLRPRRRGRSPMGRLRRVAHPGSLVLPTVLRVGIGVGVGTALGLAIDEQRGIWVGLTTAAVLLASNVTLTARRTVERITGTIAGVVLAAGVFALDPGIGVIVLALGVFQVLMQSVLFTAYGVATFFSTPIALLIVDLGVPGIPAGSLLGPRVVDTLLGCAVGLLARRFLWPQTAATRLGVAQSTAVAAARDVLHAAMTRSETPSSTLLRRSRRNLHTAALNLEAVQRDAIGDLLLSSRAADDRFTVTTAVERLCFAVMGFAAPRDHPPAGREHLEQLDAALDELAAATQGYRASPAEVVIPPITDHPATYAALRGLQGALGSGGKPASGAE